MRVRSLAVLVAVAVAVAAGVAGWFATSPEPPSLPVADGSATAGSSAEPAVDDIGAAPEGDTSYEGGRAERTDASSVVAAPPRRVRLETVLMPQAVPAAGAEVFFWEARDKAQWRALSELLRKERDTGAVLQRTGRRVVTDQDGRAEFDADEHTAISARLDDAYGQWQDGDSVTDHDGARCVVVELWPDITLHVHVRDPDGRACANVTVRAEASVTTRTRGHEEHSFDVGESDANGRVQLAHVQAFVRPPGADVVEWSMTLRCEGNHLEGVQRVVRPEELRGAEPIVLTVPVGGTIEVDVVGSDGKPALCRAALLDAADDSYCATASGDRWPTGVYAQVPLGRTWRLVDSWRFDQQLVGPTRPGETVRVRIVADSRLWTIRGTVRRSDDVEVRASAELVIKTQSGNVEPVSTPVGYRSEFRLYARLLSDIGARAVELRIVRPDAPTRTFALDRELIGGMHDLGEFVIEPPTREVVIATAEVMFEGRNVTDDAIVGLWDRDGSRPLTSVRVRSPGRLEFRGDTLPVRGEVQCSFKSAAPVCVPLRPGGHHVVELRRAASLTFSCELPPVPPWHLHVSAVPSDDAHARYPSSGDSRTFCWLDLAPGSYRIQVHAFDAVVYEQPVVLRVGHNVWPTAGERVDLSRAAAAVHVAVRDADGVRVDCKRVVIPADSSELGPGWRDRVDSTGWIPSPSIPVDVLLFEDDLVPKRVRNVRADTVVTMQRLTTVVFEPPLGGSDEVNVDVVRDGLDDPLLRELRPFHSPMGLGELPEPMEIMFAPGAELDVRVTRGGVAGPPQRIVVAARGPQRVVLH